MKKTLLSLCLCMLGMLTVIAANPKREMRSTWVAGMGIDWPHTRGTSASAQRAAKNEMIEYLDKLKAQNFNGICLHVRPRADAYYKSTLEPWSGDISGTRGKDPGWDPLAFVIEECHKRGMECYAWLNPFRINANNTKYTTDFDKEWFEKGWVLHNGNWYCFNPGIPEARRHCLDVMKEIYSNYMIDGMLFDDYFYPGDKMPQGANESQGEDYQLYKNSGTSLSLGDWRRKNVNDFIKQLYKEIQEVRPDMRFGIGPAGVSRRSASRYGLPEPDVAASDWMYDDIYCDPLAWMDDKSIDFISPQIYWSTTNTYSTFTPLAKWWSDVAAHFGIHNYISIAAYQVKSTGFGGSVAKGSQEIEKQVNLSRQFTLNNAPGAIYYNTQSINGPSITGLGDHLGSTVYTTPSLTPLIDWKGRVNYAAPAGASRSGNTLSWTATKGSDMAIIRYTVYAIPSTVDYDAAMAADGDGISGDYLLGVSYDTSYTIPADKTDGYWYAVCVFDGYGYESEPATIGYSREPSQAVSLVSPADGATVPFDATFSWTAVSNGKYRLEIARDAEFKDLFHRSELTDATTLTVALDDAEENQQLYWRVVSSQPDHASAYSEVRRITAPRKGAAHTATLTAPADGANVDSEMLSFGWQLTDGRDVENITLEIAAGGTSFAAPVYTSQLAGTARSTDVAVSRIGKGTFDWRIVTTGARIATGVSALRSFTVTNIPIGATEPGYTVKTDGVQYPDVDGLRLENLWTRSTHAPFANHQFESDGSFNRGMAATRTAVYLSARSANSSSATIFLREYNAYTGEHIRDLQLSENGIIPFYPCNDVIKDSKDNIIVTNLSLNAASTPLTLHLVDLSTGELTEIASLTANVKRIDHAGVYGDVTTGNFTVFAAVASTANLVRWRVVNGEAQSPEVKTVTAFYPSSSGNFGIAPKVHPVSDDLVYVDGGSTAWTLYNFSRPGTMHASFNQASALAPTYNSDNGGRTFDMGEGHYAVYNSDPSSVQSAKFQIVKTGATPTFADYTALWKVPQNGLGGVESTTCSAPVDAVTMSPGAAHIYIYSPGNGLAAYRLTDINYNGIGDITGTDNALGFTVSGRTVILAETAHELRAYTTAGALVTAASDASSLTLPAPGLYVIRADRRSALIHIR